MAIADQKKDRINKKVIPHLKNASAYFAQDYLGMSERELSIAVANYKREHVDIEGFEQQFCGLYNNLGVRYAQQRNYAKAFSLFCRSIRYTNDRQKIEIIYRQLLDSGLMSSKFEKLQEVTNELIKNASPEFIEVLEKSIALQKRVKNNEPEILVSGMEIKNSIFRQRLPEQIYFPKAFENMTIDFQANLTLIDHATIDCLFQISVPKQEQTMQPPYLDEPWKIDKHPEEKCEIDGGSPNLTVFLTENEHIPLNSIKIKNSMGLSIPFEQKDVLATFYIPDSYHPFGYHFGKELEIPYSKNFKYFRGKAKTIIWKIEENEKYVIEFEVKNYQVINQSNEFFSIRLGFLVPFKKIHYHDCFFRHRNLLNIHEIVRKRVCCFENRTFGIPLGLEPNSIMENEFIGAKSVIPTDKKIYDITPTRAKNFDYATFGIAIKYAVANENVSIATFEWEQPVPTALCHLLLDNKLGFPPLCQYDIINNSNDDCNLTLKTEIEGYTNKIEETKVLVPYSQIRVNHTPLFNMNKLNLRETCEASLVFSADKENKLLLKKAKRINLLAFDTMILEILNPLNRTTFRLNDFLSVWVTPHSQQIEKIISLAKEIHPKKSFVGYQGLTEQNIILSTYIQCETIFLALQDMGITYVDASLSFGGLSAYASQRIKLPDTSIETKSANCIDGAVLFASLMEHIGLRPFIITVPGHAFVGWKPSPNSRKLLFLETTQIATTDFATALEGGNQSLENGLRDARKIRNNPNLTLMEALSDGIISFIDVSLMRQKGILPQTVT